MSAVFANLEFGKRTPVFSEQEIADDTARKDQGGAVAGSESGAREAGQNESAATPGGSATGSQPTTQAAGGKEELAGNLIPDQSLLLRDHITMSNSLDSTVPSKPVTDEIRRMSGPNSSLRVVVTPERLALVAAHLKERYSVNPYYKERGDKDPGYWLNLASGMPLLPLPNDVELGLENPNK